MSSATPAAPSVALSIPATSTGAQGARVTIPVLYDATVATAGIDLGISYDPKVLRLVSIDPAFTSGNLRLLTDRRQGAPTITLSSGGSLPTGNYPLINLVFEVIGVRGQSTALRIASVRASGITGNDLSIDATIQATSGSFTVSNAYLLAYAAGNHGRIEGNTAQTVLPGGSGTSVEAIADRGYVFDSWSDSSTANPRTESNVLAPVSVSARFLPIRTTGGVPFAWYWSHNLQPSGSELDGVDSDGDGYTNRDEYISGTDPSDPVSVFRITDLNIGANGFVKLKWVGAANAALMHYEIEFSTSLGTTSWTKLGELESSSPTPEWTATRPELVGATRVFFRVVTSQSTEP
jgi:hypothetical protein